LKFIGRIISDGRVTIPEKIRELLGLKNGDYVSCEVEGVRSPVNKASPNPGTQIVDRSDPE